jgi:hypothetical protein
MPSHKRLSTEPKKDLKERVPEFEMWLTTTLDTYPSNHDPKISAYGISSTRYIVIRC